MFQAVKERNNPDEAVVASSPLFSVAQRDPWFLTRSATRGRQSWTFLNITNSDFNSVIFRISMRASKSKLWAKIVEMYESSLSNNSWENIKKNASKANHLLSIYSHQTEFISVCFYSFCKLTNNETEWKHQLLDVRSSPSPSSTTHMQRNVFYVTCILPWWLSVTVGVESHQIVMLDIKLFTVFKHTQRPKLHCWAPRRTVWFSERGAVSEQRRWLLIKTPKTNVSWWDRVIYRAGEVKRGCSRGNRTTAIFFF